MKCTKMLDLPLNTERLVLRELASDDVTEKYASWLNNPEINQYLESRFLEYQLGDIVGYIEKLDKDPSSLLFGIFIKENMDHIGNIKLNLGNLYHKRADIGIMIGDRDQWGNGYATEAITAVTQYGFEVLGLKKITAGCYESNIGSKNAFEKVGFQVEGFLRSQVETGNNREGVWQFGILPN